VQFDVDERLLREIVHLLVEAIDPDRIILSGSRARGEAMPDSDIDLLIIKDSPDPPHRRVVAAYRALGGFAVPTDILWRTPEEIEDWSGVKNYVATRAIREGRVLYEKQH
jgi:predicted nucleotidyltransferase